MQNSQSKSSAFNQHVILSGLVFLVIVAIGVASRFWLVDMPNFKPVAALLLFGGFFFRRAWTSIAALMAIMLISDLGLGTYSWQLALCVYASLALAIGLGVWVKRSIVTGQARRLGWGQVGRFAAASIGMSTAFYVLTNGAVWCMGQWYPGSWAGLVDCYVAGIPFYRATLMGDLIFTGAIVAGYALVETVLIRSKSSVGTELSSAV